MKSAKMGIKNRSKEKKIFGNCQEDDKHEKDVSVQALGSKISIGTFNLIE